MQEWQTWSYESFRFSSPDEVHIWLVPLNITDAFLQRLEKLLSRDERERAARFKFEKHRKHFIAARGQLRLLLAAYIGQEADQLCFSYNRFGKPSLEKSSSSQPMQFNISHSHEFALMAFHPEWELGVDIEWMKPDFDGLHLVKRFFSQNEQKQMEEVPDALKKEAFFNGWTRKEAYIKARGRGLNIPLAKFSVSLNPDQPARLIETTHDPEALNFWKLQAIPAPQNYKAAIVVRASSFKSVLRIGANLDRLLEKRPTNPSES